MSQWSQILLKSSDNHDKSGIYSAAQSGLKYINQVLKKKLRNNYEQLKIEW